MTEFRRRMADAFGAERAEYLARDHVIGALGHRTVDQALEAGEPAKDVWRVVCDELAVPERHR